MADAAGTGQPTRFIVQGHRGVRALDPSNALENSSDAFRQAAIVGSDIELDLQITKDHQFVVYHDEVLSREIFFDRNGQPLSRDLLLHQLTLKEIQELRTVASPEQGIESIEQVTQKLKKKFGTEVLIEFEIKYELEELRSYIHSRRITELAIEKITNLWPITKFRVRSFSIPILRHVESINAKIQTVLLTWIGNYEYTKLLGLAKTTFLAPHYPSLINQLGDDGLRRLRESGIKVIPYAVQGYGPAIDFTENFSLYRELVKKVDGFTSDSPVKLRDFMERFGVPHTAFSRCEQSIRFD